MAGKAVELKPTKKQHQAFQKLFDDKTREVYFGGAAGGGKSYLGALWLIQNCYRYPGTRWFIGRNELSRLKKSSYVTFQKACTNLGIPRSDWRLNGQDNFIEFNNGSVIDLLDLVHKPSDEMYERFGSLEYTGGWIEEAGEVNETAYEVLKSRIGRYRNDDYDLYPAKLLVTCNPKKNWLYREVYKPWKEKRLIQTTSS